MHFQPISFLYFYFQLYTLKTIPENKDIMSLVKTHEDQVDKLFASSLENGDYCCYSLLSTHVYLLEFICDKDSHLKIIKDL